MRTHHTIDSPIGRLTLVAAAGELCGLYLEQRVHAPNPADLGAATAEGFAGIVEQLAEYFAGQRTEFTVPARPPGTDFQRRVWAAVTEIPYGQTRTYAEIARDLGGVAASRAVGAANGRNPVAIVIPCHRVVGSDGSLTGYGGGLGRKRFLLDLEGAGRTDLSLF